ncbi:hypothetical protein BDQ12DRAFT_689593 [Crucibulum laeve]|uniref:Uncharacterized protein n=1 Tax=Crucibulum laeve TaxID=68775 RepID=A0A5C3LNQ9_9AGAR|nr:hypothetical protein BDQ12DRAFT_689593 [Crucibulum laeve]
MRYNHNYDLISRQREYEIPLQSRHFQVTISVNGAKWLFRAFDSFICLSILFPCCTFLFHAPFLFDLVVCTIFPLCSHIIPCFLSLHFRFTIFVSVFLTLTGCDKSSIPDTPLSFMIAAILFCFEVTSETLGPSGSTTLNLDSLSCGLVSGNGS